MEYLRCCRFLNPAPKNVHFSYLRKWQARSYGENLYYYDLLNGGLESVIGGGGGGGPIIGGGGGALAGIAGGGGGLFAVGVIVLSSWRTGDLDAGCSELGRSFRQLGCVGCSSVDAGGFGGERWDLGVLFSCTTLIGITFSFSWLRLRAGWGICAQSKAIYPDYDNRTTENFWKFTDTISQLRSILIVLLGFHLFIFFFFYSITNSCGWVYARSLIIFISEKRRVVSKAIMSCVFGYIGDESNFYYDFLVRTLPLFRPCFASFLDFCFASN